MSQRKLQAEIDKTLKAVAIGVEVFEATFDKLHNTTNATQKDKTETDLKSQIKKLQRSRDQIKNWLGSSDIKDKTALLDNRKLIETQMERFKALEKEMKMKAFSKEGLIAQSRLDPAEKAKREVIDWIGNTNDELSRQIEQTEAEAETLNTGKKKKGQGDRLSELESLNERRQWHIGRLEVVQRMLENGQLNADQVKNIEDDVKYFVEANTEEGFEEDEGIYDELNLMDEDPDYGGDAAQQDDTSNLDSASVADQSESASVAPFTSAPKTPAKETKEEKEKESPMIVSTSKKHTSAKQSTSTPSAIAATEEATSPVQSKKTPAKKNSMDNKAGATAGSIGIVEKSPTKELPTSTSTSNLSASAGTPQSKSLPPIRYAAAAAAAVGVTPAQLPSIPSIPAQTTAEEAASKEDITSTEALEETAYTNGHTTTAPPPPPGLSRSPAPLQSTTSITSPPQSSSQPLNGLTSQSSQPGSARSPSSSIPAPPGYSQPIPTTTGAASGEYSRAGSSAGVRGTSPLPQPGLAGASGSGQAQGVLGNLMQSFDVAKELSERRSTDMSELNAALDMSYANAPHHQDSEPPRYYHPKNPMRTPSYYPQSRLPILEDKRFFSRMETDQLFFVFYYMVGTYEQWLAAQELKAQSWRFHKQYLTWFQRAHNPQAVTSDYEQGGYFYFDWENSWCQRKKSDFRFEYRWLSDD